MFFFQKNITSSPRIFFKTSQHHPEIFLEHHAEIFLKRHVNRFFWKRIVLLFLQTSLKILSHAL